MKTHPYHNPRRPRSTRDLMISLLQALAVLVAILWLTQCAPKAYPVGTPNPLDSYATAPLDRSEPWYWRHVFDPNNH